MNIIVRKATESDIDNIAGMWYQLNEYLARPDVTNYPRWKNGIYPLPEHAEEAVADGSMHIALDGDKVVGTAVYSTVQGKEYRDADWQTDFDVPVYVICKLAVHPDYWNKNVGKALMDHAAETGRANGIKAIRRDTFEENQPTVRFFLKNGFTYCGLIDLGLEKIYGLKWYKVFEKLL
ncbi:MAG: GNAT family N-acetyltransferase [Oscillospiraceae bacterium]|nr:GNAT family N-acetyltransferase [Oscillospiraceae bacterium]